MKVKVWVRVSLGEKKDKRCFDDAFLIEFKTTGLSLISGFNFVQTRVSAFLRLLAKVRDSVFH